jgi:hypothetical protein
LFVTTLAATTRIPQPLACIGVVSNDLPQRTLTVRLSDLEQGYVRLLWREAWRALKASEQSGWRGQQVVWANTDTADSVASAATGDSADGGRLVFAFAPGQQAYQQLISKPGLTAFVMLDPESHRFLSAKFRHGR